MHMMHNPTNGEGAANKLLHQERRVQLRRRVSEGGSVKALKKPMEISGEKANYD
jgi:hypothetical protein